MCKGKRTVEEQPYHRVLLGLRGKAYYFGPAYPALYAAGAVTLEHIARPRLGVWVRWGTVAVIVAFGLFALPLGLPILPPEAMARYAGNIGAARRNNQGELGRLPQDYADMLGWEEQVRAVARVYQALPPAERAEAVIVGDNYGEAGALAFYGPRYGLPAPVSAAGTFWQFGPGDKPGAVVVVLGEEPQSLRTHADWATAQHYVAGPLAFPRGTVPLGKLCTSPCDAEGGARTRWTRGARPGPTFPISLQAQDDHVRAVRPPRPRVLASTLGVAHAHTELPWTVATPVPPTCVAGCATARPR